MNFECHRGDDQHVNDCLRYWERLRGDRFAPAWRDFDWFEIDPHLIPLFSVVDVGDQGRDFVYRFWGTWHAKMTGQELTGKSVWDIQPAAEGHAVFNQIAETVTARKPVLFDHAIQTPRYRAGVRAGTLRLPFSNDNEHVTHVVSFTDIRHGLAEPDISFSA